MAAVAVVGCGSSHVSSSARSQIITVTSSPPSRGRLASICDKTEYELNVVYRHTVAGAGPREFKERLTKLATQSLPVIESALVKVQSMNGRRAAKAKADLQSSRRQVLLLERTIAQAHSDNYGAFPRGTLANLWRVIVGCAHSRKPING
jgi:hypothetical protein